jgi:hypothetical protein
VDGQQDQPARPPGFTDFQGDMQPDSLRRTACASLARRPASKVGTERMLFRRRCRGGTVMFIPSP